MMAASWFKKPDPKEQMRDNDRALRRTNRDLEKDRSQLDRQEKEVEAEIRKLAKQGNRQACATLAKQLINIRKQKTKSYGMSAKVSAVATQTKTMYSSAKMADAMKTTTQTMTTVNKQLNPQQLAKTMQDFEKANMQMDMGDEMINETLDSMLDESGDEEEQDAIVNQVLDEIGIDLNAQLSKAPLASSTIGTPAAAERMTDADVDRMLAGLR